MLPTRPKKRRPNNPHPHFVVSSRRRRSHNAQLTLPLGSALFRKSRLRHFHVRRQFLQQVAPIHLNWLARSHAVSQTLGPCIVVPILTESRRSSNSPSAA